MRRTRLPQPCDFRTRQGLIYKSQQEIAYEVQKVQRPVKESYDRIVKGVDRITKLLEITKMTPADQTETRLLLDKAAEIADLIKKEAAGALMLHTTSRIVWQRQKAILPRHRF